MKKKQNTRRNIAECIHKIYSYGMFVTAGFIVGFDTEKASMGQAMIDFIEEANIPVCMVGLLYALPGTQRIRRLAAEGRLHKGHDLMKAEQAGDQCTLGCNFDTKRPLHDILADYKAVLGHVFSPTAYAGRLSRLAAMLDRSDRRRDLPDGDVRKRLGGIDSVHKIIASPAGGSRAVLEDLRRSRQDQSGRAALHRDADGAIHAPRAVLETRDRRD